MISFFTQFQILNVLSLNLVTNIICIYILFIFLIVIIKRKNFLINNTWNIFLYNVLKTISLELKINLNKNRSGKYVYIILSIFIIILLLNIFGLFPYIYSVTSNVSLTVGLSFLVITSCIFISINLFKDIFFCNFLPEGSPMILAPFLVIIETVSYFARIISLGVRLAANITAGHLLLVILASFGMNMLYTSCPLLISLAVIPIIIMVCVIVLEIVVSIIQACVFCLLISIYIGESQKIH